MVYKTRQSAERGSRGAWMASHCLDRRANDLGARGMPVGMVEIIRNGKVGGRVLQFVLGPI
jgi:hypothetical protein